MPWLKVVHICAVIVWAGALTLLPAAIRAQLPIRGEAEAGDCARPLLLAVASPAALIAIASGTAIFVLEEPAAPWLVAKLGAVGVLVLAHAMFGWLLLRVERAAGAHVPSVASARHAAAGLAFGALSVVALLAVALLVLLKPALAAP